MRRVRRNHHMRVGDRAVTLLGRGVVTKAMSNGFYHVKLDNGKSIVLPDSAVAPDVGAYKNPRRNGTKGSYPFAEKEAQYAGFTDAQLAYARKDAAAAMRAMAGHDPKAEAWYADDVHTIAAEQMRRKRATRTNGSETWLLRGDGGYYDEAFRGSLSQAVGKAQVVADERGHTVEVYAWGGDRPTKRVRASKARAKTRDRRQQYARAVGSFDWSTASKLAPKTRKNGFNPIKRRKKNTSDKAMALAALKAAALKRDARSVEKFTVHAQLAGATPSEILRASAPRRNGARRNPTVYTHYHVGIKTGSWYVTHIGRGNKAKKISRAAAEAILREPAQPWPYEDGAIASLYWTPPEMSTEAKRRVEGAWVIARWTWLEGVNPRSGDVVREMR
jgi:hypothetical protein